MCLFTLFQPLGTCSDSRGDKLEAGEILISDQYLTSPNCAYSLWAHANGNLILYKGLTSGRKSLWASRTAGKGTAPYKLTMNAADNHLFLTDTNGDTLWSTTVYGGKWKLGGRMALQDDGNLVVYDGDRDAMWESGTNGGRSRLASWSDMSSGKGDGIIHEKGTRTLNYFQIFKFYRPTILIS